MALYSGYSRLGLGIACAVLLSFSSAAHANLETPPQQPRIVQVEGANLLLTFSAVVNVSASTAEIRDAANHRIPTQRLVAGENGVGIKVPLDAPLRAGLYTVKWNAYSMDGRQSVGTYNFTIGPSPEPTGVVAQN